MSKHNLNILPSQGRLAVVIVCRKCKDPEPVTNEHTWRDTNDDVYFDSIGIAPLFVFLMHHDAFGLSFIAHDKDTTYCASLPEHDCDGATCR